MRKANSRQVFTPDLNSATAQEANGRRPTAEASHVPISMTSPNSDHGSRPGSPHDVYSNFNLAPPPPKHDLTTIDGLSERLFSEDHLHLILHDPTHFLRFTTFINKHRLKTAPLLNRYLETQKAIKAIEYANAVAETIHALPQDHSSFAPCAAAMLDGRFEARSRRAFETLVNDGLSSYITRVLIDAVSDSMVKEITGNTLPVMRDLVAGLAEVFCLTDPSQKDNPIVYASEEFYRTTQYGRDYVIGRNCRFLQGPSTHKPTVARISSAIKQGQEICETVLNYRRDGSPFLNLLMIAPLYDNRGVVRYFIGAQVDVTRLVEEGRGIDSFERLLAEDRAAADREESGERIGQEPETPKKPLEALGELGEMLTWEETIEIQQRSRTTSLRDDVSVHSVSLNPNSKKNIATRPGGRRVLGTENEEEESKLSWGLSNGLSGRLPGLYTNYLLVRPHPSLRIIFVSPALRIPGLLQSRFLSHIGGSLDIRNGIEDAFASGIPVTAKVSWLPHGRANDNIDDDASSVATDDYEFSMGPKDRDRFHNESWYTNGGNRHGPGDNGQVQAQAKTRWLSCTPLLGSDDRVGVWMVVMVEDPNPGRIAGVRTANAAAVRSPNPNNIIDNAMSSIKPVTNGHDPTSSFDSARRVQLGTPAHTSSIRKPHSKFTDSHRPESPRIHTRHADPLQEDSFPPPPSAHGPIPTPLTSSSSTVPTTTVSSTLSRHDAPGTHSPRVPGSWSPTLSATAVENWIPTGYGGDVLAPGAVREGRRDLEFAVRGRGGLVGEKEGRVLGLPPGTRVLGRERGDSTTEGALGMTGMGGMSIAA